MTQPYSLFNFEVETLSQKRRKSRIGLTHRLTGVPVFLIYLKGIEKPFSIPSISVAEIDTFLQRETDSQNWLAWRMVRVFFESGGTRAHLCASPLVGESSQEWLTSLIGKDHGFTLRSGIYTVKNALDQADLVVVPQAPYLLERNHYQIFCQTLFDWVSTQRSLFAIMDMPNGITPEEAIQWAAPLNGIDAALYYPWLIQGEHLFPSSPTIAAVYQSSDHDLKISENPTNRSLYGNVIPLTRLTAHQSVELNQNRINTVLSFRDNPALLWGAKTLAPESHSEFRFIATRRTLKSLADAITSICDHFVLEPLRSSTLEVLKNELDDFFYTHQYLFNKNRTKPYKISLSSLETSEENGILVDCSFYLNTCIENLHLSIGVDL